MGSHAQTGIRLGLSMLAACCSIQHRKHIFRRTFQQRIVPSFGFARLVTRFLRPSEPFVLPLDAYSQRPQPVDGRATQMVCSPDPRLLKREGKVPSLLDIHVATVAIRLLLAFQSLALKHVENEANLCHTPD